MQFRLIVVWRYKTTVYRQNTNIEIFEIIYVYASEEKLCISTFQNLLYKLV